MQRAGPWGQSAGGWFAAMLLTISACASRISEPPTASPSLKPADISSSFVAHGRNGQASEPAMPGKPEAKADASIVDRELDEYELEGLVRLARKAESIRGLTFRSLPRVRVQNRAGIRAAFMAKTDPKELELNTLRYRALGLLADDEDLVKQGADLVESSVLGYYDSETKQLVLRDDVARVLRFRLGADPDWIGTIVHELVHALQDQHFDLTAGRSGAESDDARSAYAALVEGDATLAMIKYATGHFGVKFESLISNAETLETLILSRMRPPPSINGPPAVHGLVAFRYSAGAGFAASLMRQGGQPALDRAFRAPPRSSAEILDPALFLATRRGERITSFARQSLEEAGVEVLEEQVLGMIVTNAYLACSGQNADGISAAWTSDRFLLLRINGKQSYVWVLSFTGVAEAARAYELVQGTAAMQRRLRRMITVQQRNRYLLVTGDVPTPLRKRVARQFVVWADRRE